MARSRVTKSSLVAKIKEAANTLMTFQTLLRMHEIITQDLLAQIVTVQTTQTKTGMIAQTKTQQISAIIANSLKQRASLQQVIQVEKDKIAALLEEKKKIKRSKERRALIADFKKSSQEIELKICDRNSHAIISQVLAPKPKREPAFIGSIETILVQARQKLAQKRQKKVHFPLYSPISLFPQAPALALPAPALTPTTDTSTPPVLPAPIEIAIDLSAPVDLQESNDGWVNLGRFRIMLYDTIQPSIQPSPKLTPLTPFFDADEADETDDLGFNVY